MPKSEIAILTDEIKALREVLEAMQRDAAYYRSGETTVPPIPDGDDTPSKPEPANANTEQTTEPAQNNSEQAAEPEQPVTREALSQLCLSLIRSKAASKDQLVGMIGKYNNAKTLKEVPDDDIPALASELYALEVK